MSQISQIMKDSTSLVCGKIYAPNSDKPSVTKEYRAVWLRTYCPEEELVALLSSLDLEAYAYILHDKDVNSEGELHPPHFHCVFHMAYPKKVRATRISKYLKSGNSRIELVRDKYKCYEYLTHKNSPDKYQYPEEDIKGQNKAFYIRLSCASKEERREQDMSVLLDDVLDLPMRDFALKYGRDGLLRYTQYRDFALECLAPKQRELYKMSDFYVQVADSFSRFYSLLDSLDPYQRRIAIDRCVSSMATAFFGDRLVYQEGSLETTVREFTPPHTFEFLITQINAIFRTLLSSYEFRDGLWVSLYTGEIEEGLD